MDTYFTQEEAMRMLHHLYRSLPQPSTDRQGERVTLPPRTARAMYLAPADCYLIGVVWADMDGVEWMTKRAFERIFGEQ